MKFIVIALIAIFSFSSMASDSCANPNYSMIDMKKCVDLHAKKADAELNQVYKQVMGKLDEEKQELLRTAQRTWIKFRDQDCAVVVSFVKNGSASGLYQLNCELKKTQDRVEDLKDILTSATM